MGRILKFRHRPLPRSPKKDRKPRKRIIEGLLLALIVISSIGVFLMFLFEENYSNEDGGTGMVTTRAAGGGTIRGIPRVVDGDTIHMGSLKIRLQGIDAPESKQECEQQDGKRYRCGERASRKLKKLIGQFAVECNDLGTDRYGRTLAKCYADGMDLNGEMVKSGWAVAYRKYSVDYVPEEVMARWNGAGIWQGEFDYPWDWRRAKR